MTGKIKLGKGGVLKLGEGGSITRCTITVAKKGRRYRHRWNSAGTQKLVMSQKVTTIFEWCEHCGALKVYDVAKHRGVIRYAGGGERKVGV